MTTNERQQASDASISDNSVMTLSYSQTDNDSTPKIKYHLKRDEFIAIFQLIENSYHATNECYEEWAKQPQISIIKRAVGGKNYTFLLCEMTKRAVLKNSAILNSAVKNIKNSNKSQVKDVDKETKYCISDEQARTVISQFLNDENNKGFTLVVSVGSPAHEGCLFIRKDENNKYVFVLFNPNKERMSSAERLMRKLSSKYRYSAYFSKDNNPRGECAALTQWEINKFLVHNYEIKATDVMNANTRKYEEILQKT